MHKDTDKVAEALGRVLNYLGDKIEFTKPATIRRSQLVKAYRRVQEAQKILKETP